MAEKKDKPKSHSDNEAASPSEPLSPDVQVLSDSEKFETMLTDEDAPTEEQSDSANCTIIPIHIRKQVFRQEVTTMQETVTSVFSKITSPPILRAATNDDTLVGMIRDISGKISVLHEAVKKIESSSAEKVFTAYRNICNIFRISALIFSVWHKYNTAF